MNKIIKNTGILMLHSAILKKPEIRNGVVV